MDIQIKIESDDIALYMTESMTRRLNEETVLLYCVYHMFERSK